MRAKRSKYRKTFNEVLHNCDNQVIVRNLIEQTLTNEQKQFIIDGFNSDVDKRNKMIDQRNIDL